MATDVDVQYFSHLNGLVLGNNWGDMIRLLDTCLVNGLPLTEITSASIDAQGDILITTYAAHKCMLFQIIELTGFTPTELNGKYRIKGTPSENQLVLKATHVGKSVATKGAGKLASLGYEIIFRDTGDVKRVYRAKNPRAEHPFIRVDESLTSPDGTSGVYTSSYAKYAMIGLLENMTHIDDFENPDVLQLPFEPSDTAKNWRINGAGAACVRGWSRWYWARGTGAFNSSADSDTPQSGNRPFTLCGCSDAFYLIKPYIPGENRKIISGCGLFSSSLDSSVIPNWFLISSFSGQSAGTRIDFSADSVEGGVPLAYGETSARFMVPNYKGLIKLASTSKANPILHTYTSGRNAFGGSQVAALSIPFYDSNAFLRGNLPHIMYSGSSIGSINTTATLSGSSMYVDDTIMVEPRIIGGGVSVYLGELV